MGECPLILLFGMPRSGTTWVGKLLDSHPDTLYRHEPDSWGRLNRIPLVVSVDQSEEYEDMVREFAAALPWMQETKVAGSLPTFPKRHLSPFRYRMHQAGILGAKVAARLFGERPVPACANYADVENLGVVWKSIESIGRLGLLARALPESRGILLIRHPCGYIASIWRGERKQQFTDSLPASEDFGVLEWLLESSPARGRNLSLKAFRAMAPEERLAWRWTLFNEKAMEDLEGINRFTVVRYEDLCQRPVEETRKMLQKVGLTMHPQTEAFLERSTGSYQGGYYSIYRDSRHVAERWREELDNKVIERVSAITRGSRPGELYA